MNDEMLERFFVVYDYIDDVKKYKRNRKDKERTIGFDASTESKTKIVDISPLSLR